MKYKFLVLLIFLAILIGGCTINKNNFEKDTLNIAEIFQNCISEVRYLKRSEINELNKYLNKYEKIESPKKEVIVDLYSDFLLSHTHLKESDEVEVNKYLQKMSEQLKEVTSN